MNPTILTSFAILLLISTTSAQFKWSANPNNAGGLNLGGSYTKQIGQPNHHASGTVFGSGNLNPGNNIRLTDKNYGAGINYHNNGHGLSYQHSQNKHSSTDAARGTVNLFDNGSSKVNANVWGERTRLHKRQINRVDQYGGNVEWQHRNGHSASLGTNNIPQFNKQTIDANANVNLWKHKDARLDAYGSASHNIGQHQRGRTDWNTGIKFEKRF
ncbi:unnamed protein product [Chironomus riparius]|uniref:Attacin C-terminal domain-containing protein n=1 Tax=Chironomus riparius TaxID=315576 RepID=A0A9N9RXS9_9DIPT|nr:unnamed protein product [Chironomus riparius]